MPGITDCVTRPRPPATVIGITSRSFTTPREIAVPTPPLPEVDIEVLVNRTIAVAVEGLTCLSRV